MIEILGNYFKNFASNKYLKFKNRCQKSDSILDSKGRKICDEFQETSKNEEIILKHKELI